MKAISYSIFIGFFLLILASCDYVSNPYPEVNINLGDTGTCPVPTFPTVTAHVKKILIEDYTGHTCGNCPGAANKLHELDTTYPGRVVGLAVHVGSTFASPAPGYSGTPSYAFTADFRTHVGEAYESVFGADAFGLPEGMFNRKDFNATTQSHLKQVPNWSSYMASIIGEPSVADLQIITNYDAGTRKVCAAVKTQFLTALSGTYKLVVLLTQDSVKSTTADPNIGWQDVFGVKDSAYIHRHMLRDVMSWSGAWGDTIASGSITAGASNTIRFAYNIPDFYVGTGPLSPATQVHCHPEHCHIVAFIYNTATYEVIQVEEAKVIP